MSGQFIRDMVFANPTSKAVVCRENNGPYANIEPMKKVREML
jgi:hypothetical protein